MVPIRLARWFAPLLWLVSTLPVGAAEPAERGRLSKLNDITGTDVIEAKITSLVDQGDQARKLLKLASKLARAEQSFSPNALYILARTAHGLKEIDIAVQFYRLGVEEALRLQSGREYALTLGGLIDLFFENRMYDETVKVCQELLRFVGNESIDRLKPIVAERLVEALARQNKFDEAMILVDKLVEAEDEAGGWWALLIKGDLLRQAERTEEAAKTYTLVLERLAKDAAIPDELKRGYLRRVRYVLSGAYTDLNQVDQAVEQLQVLLKEKPDDPTYNNDLGYLWADHDRNLEQAEKLIRKALKEARKQTKTDTELSSAFADYLDSLGWVLFKQTRYADAKRYLLRAVKDMEKPEIDILDHLGDVHLALGEREEARKVFQEAVEAAGSTNRDQRRKAEVEEKLQMLGD